jgi:hypothetical protein
LIAADVRRVGLIGRVHSVFQRAVNVELLDGELVTLVTPRGGGLPNGVVLDAETDLRTLVRERELVWGDVGLRLCCLNLTVELAGAEVWSPLLEPRGGFPPFETVRGDLAKTLLQRDVHGGFAEALRTLAAGGSEQEVCATWPAVSALLHATRAGEVHTAASAAHRLIGLGPGLTPSGDDFLVGYCASLRAARHALHSELAEACWHMAKGRTTRIAETFYRYAARGAFSERIHRLIDSPAELQHALDWGATSGADCVLGVLLGGEAVRVGVLGEAA